jgi:hypothetical protein
VTNAPDGPHTSAVPYGTGAKDYFLFQALKVLGYCQLPLRGTAVNTRETSLGITSQKRECNL